MKRLLYLLTLLAALGIAVAAFFFFRYRSEPTAPPPEETPLEGTLPADAKPLSLTPPAEPEEKTPEVSQPAAPVSLGGGLRIISHSPTAAFAAAPNGDVVAVGTNGTVIAVRGAVTDSLSPTTIADLRSAKFSANAAKLLALFGDAEAPQAGVFDVTSKTWQPFPLSVVDFAWAPEGLRAAYLARQKNMTVLGVLDLGDAKGKPQELARFHFADVALSWPSGNRLFLKERASALVPVRAWNFDVKAKTLTPFAEEQRGLEVMWSRDEGLAFVAGEGGRGGNLYLISPQGSIREGLSLLTLPEKCAFSHLPASQAGPPAFPAAPKATSTAPSALPDRQAGAPTALFCAVPRDTAVLRNTPLPDAYYKKSHFTSDVFYEINLGSGATRTLFDDPAKSLDATQLAVSDNVLYFINRYDRKLYSLSIK
jgi:hypothetical protein